ncbi:MAG: cytochrome c-type biogenesis protein [Planktomarina sp.]
MRGVLILFMCVWANLTVAVEPDEILSDPLLETRARAISEGLRCLQCRNESIDESSAGIARDLRVLVRTRLLAGDSDTEVIDYIVDRYGEYVLLKPNGLGTNLVLWLTGPVMLILTLLGLVWASRRRMVPIATDLNEDEELEIQKLMSK